MFAHVNVKIGKYVKETVLPGWSLIVCLGVVSSP